MVQEVLAHDRGVFFANTHAFLPEDLENARTKNFKIIQLRLPQELMESRNRHRMEHQGYDDVSMYFTYMIEYQHEIKDKGLVDTIINADQPVEIIAREVLKALEAK
jgi:hypothetical protein